MKTAFNNGHRVLYHYQRFNPQWLEELLTTNSIHCSSPADFNDPWDCKAHFNTEILHDPAELERHIHWALELCAKSTPAMSAVDLANMEQTLLTDHQRAADLIGQISVETGTITARDYRVYCLTPDNNNLLMWSHYGDAHRGICLEFSLRNVVMCSALGCIYGADYPIIPVNSNTLLDSLKPLLCKSDIWRYENEYRLIAREGGRLGVQTLDNELRTHQNKLQLPAGALTGIIVGCQGNFESVRAMAAHLAPNVRVRQARRIPNRYALAI